MSLRFLFALSGKNTVEVEACLNKLEKFLAVLCEHDVYRKILLSQTTTMAQTLRGK